MKSTVFWLVVAFSLLQGLTFGGNIGFTYRIEEQAKPETNKGRQEALLCLLMQFLQRQGKTV
jgi:hypothetical protein